MSNRLSRQLFQPVDISGLVLFRIVFGLMMAFDSLRYVLFGWVHSHYLDPPILLKFHGFEWVHPISPFFVYGVFGVMVASGLGIALGWFYRTSCLLFFLGHSYVFLLSAAHYLNHAYLISVWALLMAFVPAQRALSVDAWLNPEIHSLRIPAWPRWMLVGMLTMVYGFGALAKMNPDWLAAEPVRHWMTDSAGQVPALGDIIASETFVWVVAWGGLLFDLLIAPLLLWRRTRIIGAVISAGFHLTNAYLFHIGVFPWFMLAATTLFFDPAWLRRMGQTGRELCEAIETVGAPDDAREQSYVEPTERRQNLVVRGLVILAAVQLLVPLRHHLYRGDVAWTEEGHCFSWRMKLRNKRGSAVFRVRDPETGRQWTERPEWRATERQAHKLTCRPDLLLQFAHVLRDAYLKEEGATVEVFADVHCSLNYRPRQRLVDPSVDLAKESLSFRHYEWLIPLTTPLRPKAP
ncbi:MAG: HTTM domain-containing protein [Polyangiaceae bacterium]